MKATKLGFQSELFHRPLKVNELRWHLTFVKASLASVLQNVVVSLQESESYSYTMEDPVIMQSEL